MLLRPTEGWTLKHDDLSSFHGIMVGVLRYTDIDDNRDIWKWNIDIVVKIPIW